MDFSMSEYVFFLGFFMIVSTIMWFFLGFLGLLSQFP